MTITIEQLVNREVHYCVSMLVSTLAKGYGDTKGELGELAEKAFELSCPIDDWQEGAEQAGWQWDEDGARFLNDKTGDAFLTSGDSADWQQVCETYEIEPYQWDVFEHWLVSDWLAEKLEKHGEKVDRDFDGLSIWGRTTTGQGIANDSVIEKIYAELIAA